MRPLLILLFAGFTVPSLLADERLSKTDVAYGAHPKQVLDVYWNRSFTQAPIVVNIHGGGWIGGDKAGFGNRGYQNLIVDQLGCVLVSPNYRLIGDFADGDNSREMRAKMAGKVDGMISDVASAVAYVQQHAADFGADPKNVVVMGSSAGGHLSAALAYCNARDWLEGTPYAGETLNIVGWFGDSAPLTKALNSQIPFNEDGIPLSQVDEGDPPGFMIVGTRDRLVPVENSTQFLAALERLGIWGQVVICKDAGHVVGKRVVDRQELQEPFVAFVRYVIGKAGAPETGKIINLDF